MKLIGKLRADDRFSTFTIGVGTPSRAHGDLIDERLRTADLDRWVTDGTTRRYRSDKRDLMIFSPVGRQRGPPLPGWPSFLGAQTGLQRASHGGPRAPTYPLAVPRTCLHQISGLLDGEKTPQLGGLRTANLQGPSRIGANYPHVHSEESACSGAYGRVAAG